MIVADALSNWIALSFHLLVADASSTVTLSTRKICLVNCFLIGFSALFSVPLPEKRIFSPPFEAKQFFLSIYFLLGVLLMETKSECFGNGEANKKKIHIVSSIHFLVILFSKNNTCICLT